MSRRGLRLHVFTNHLCGSSFNVRLCSSIGDHRTSNAKVTCSNAVKASIFFGLNQNYNKILKYDWLLVGPI